MAPKSKTEETQNFVEDLSVDESNFETEFDDFIFDKDGDNECYLFI